MVKIKIDLAHRKNYGSARDLSKIKYLVVHYTANDGDSDEGNANYFNAYRGVSAHYFVDDDSITQSVPDGCVAWAVGGAKWADCSKTGGGKWYNKCTNNNSISVELCDTVRDGKSGFTEKTLQNAADLIKLLMKKYNIPIDNVIRHFDVTGKHCPAPMMNPKPWAEFKARLEDDEMVTTVKVVTGDRKTTVNRILKDGTNYIKVRDIAAVLGYDVSAKNGEIILTKK
jgi:N-acetylmuramoyl-L-alanine amidase CwlA